MNIAIIIILLVLLAGQKANGGNGGGNGGGGTPPPPTCSDSKFARMQGYIWLLKSQGNYRSFVDLQQRAPRFAAVLQREYGDCRGWNNW